MKTDRHIVLLGGQPFADPVLEEVLVERLQENFLLTNLSRDGARIADVHRQVMDVPDSATHLFLAAGTAELVDALELLDHPATTVGQAMASLHGIAKSMGAEYYRVLKAIKEQLPGMPVTPCTLQARLGAAAECLVWLLEDKIRSTSLSHRALPIDLGRVVYENCHFDHDGITLSDEGRARLAGAVAGRAVNYRYDKVGEFSPVRSLT